MKKKILKWLLDNWRTFAEIGVVIWAIQGMHRMMLSFSIILLTPLLLFYFLSALLILYLLRKK